MNCKKCRWYRETFIQHTINGTIYKGMCLLGGCDGSQYEPKGGAKMDEVTE